MTKKELKYVAILVCSFIITTYLTFWCGKHEAPREWWIDASIFLGIIALIIQAVGIMYIIGEGIDEKN